MNDKNFTVEQTEQETGIDTREMAHILCQQAGEDFATMEDTVENFIFDYMRTPAQNPYNTDAFRTFYAVFATALSRASDLDHDQTLEGDA